MTGIASGEGEQGTSRHMQKVSDKSGREMPAEDLNDPQFWDRVGPLLFHSVRAAARLARPAAPAGAAAAPWPRFSGNVRMFSAFREEWRRVRESVKSPLSNDTECEIFREQAVDQATARRLANFFSMEQVWDFMEAVYGKPGQVLARIEHEVRDHRMVPRGDREAARRRRADLSAMTTQAALHRVRGLWASTDNFNICLSKLEEECRRAWDAVRRLSLIHI